MTAYVIFNPSSDGGRTGREWREIEAALESVFPLLSFFVTTGPGQAARMVRDALREGHMEIIAVGGEGTINEALNGFFDRGVAVSPDATFSFVHNGATDALCRRLGVPPGWRGGIAHLRQARIARVDVGQVTCLSPDGTPVTRYFLGGASFGISGSIARNLGRSRIARFFGHGFAHFWHSLAALWRWRGCRVRLRATGYDEIAGIASVALTPRDAAFDLTVLGGRGKSSLLHDLGAMTSGDVGGVVRLRSTRLTAAPTLDTLGAVDVETDGEIAGVLPATFEIYPNTINIRL